MGQLWTEEMEAELERWQAIEEEAASPKDFLIARHINMNDRLHGFAHYAAAGLRYWVVGGWRPLPLRQQIDSANIDRQIGRERLAEIEAWLKEEPFDFFEDVDRLSFLRIHPRRPLI